MKHHKKLAMLLAGTQLLLALSACSTSDSGTTSSNSSDKDTSTSTPAESKAAFDLDNLTDVVLETAGIAADTVVATAGGRDITAGTVLALAVSELDYLNDMAMYGLGEIPWGEEIDGEIYEAAALQTATELALIYQLIVEVAEEEGLAVDDDFHAGIEGYLDNILNEIGGNETIYQYVLWQALTTEEAFVENSIANELYNKIFEARFTEGGTEYPADDEIMSKMEELNYYRVKHVLISTVDANNEPFSDSDKAAALEKAEGILAELQASSDLDTDFQTIMLERSEDPGSMSNPDGYSATPGQMVPEFEEASLALEEGGLSEIVESSFGYHIIYRLPLVADDSVVDTIVGELANQMQAGWLEANPIETNAEYDTIDLKTFYENLNTLRMQLQPYVEAGDPDIVVEETPVEDSEETTDEAEAETADEAEEESADEESADEAEEESASE